MNSVSLLKGIFKESEDKGKEYLLYLDPDRLLAPCYEAIGREPKKPRYGGWEAKDISGHSLGHFLSALSVMYVADNDERLKEKLDYIVNELAYLQSLDDENYVSGFPKTCFNNVFSGDFTVSRFELGGGWVPWYSIHKIYAGLIDAYKFTGNELALEVVIKLSNWAVNGTDKLSDEQFEKVLYCEHGGMCEAMADLYTITKNEDYLNLAIRFIDKEIVNPLIEGKDDLEGKHANTQIPKVIGLAKLYNITHDERYKKACEFFWNVVTKERSYVIGGNSKDEHFGKACTESLGTTTAETCNTYNMMKLTEELYLWNHKSEYMDYYEKALYNHILASQDPETGMKTYFVSTEPGQFKVYCTPDNSFWCCTGTGMENPGRYIRNIYYYENNDLYINLFISSIVSLENGEVILEQETDFPNVDKTTLKIKRSSNKLQIIKFRVPNWISDDMHLNINGKAQNIIVKDNYIILEGKWNADDVIEITLPMSINLYKSKEDNNKIAILYGPIVLAGALGKNKFPKTDIVEDHLKYINYDKFSVNPLIGDEEIIINSIKKNKSNELSFTLNNIKLIPFYKLHHERYTLYWDMVSEEVFNDMNYKKSDLKIEDTLIIDSINPGQQQSEIEHKFKSNNSIADYSKKWSKSYRMCTNGGEFSYELSIAGYDEAKLLVCYGNEYKENTKNIFNVLIDNRIISTEEINQSKEECLIEKTYLLDKEFLKEKDNILISFKCEEACSTNKVYSIKVIS